LKLVTAISAGPPTSTHSGTEASGTPLVGRDTDAPLLMADQGGKAAVP